jgi:hypothetical protein
MRRLGIKGTKIGVSNLKLVGGLMKSVEMSFNRLGGIMALIVIPFTLFVINWTTANLF